MLREPVGKRSAWRMWLLSLLGATLAVYWGLRWTNKLPTLGKTGVSWAFEETLEVPMLDPQLMTCDLSGHGTPDVVIKTRALRGSEVVPILTAFEARSGKLLWSIDLLGPLGASAIACFGATALEATQTSLAGYDLAARKRIWQTPLPERVDKFCAEDGGRASFIAADKQSYQINLATGALSKREQLEASCSRPSSIDGFREAGAGVAMWWATSGGPSSFQPSPAPNHIFMEPTEGMGTRELWREGTADLLLAAGHKWPGSGTPMIGAVKVTENVRGTLLWKAELASKNPLGFRTGSAAVNLRGGRVVSIFLNEVDKQYVVGSWELATGRRQWEVTIPRDLSLPSRHLGSLELTKVEQVCQGIAQTDRQVFVACSNTLGAYAIENGKVLWTLHSP